MGNHQNKQLAPQTKREITLSGQAHVSTLGSVMDYCQGWPTPPKEKGPQTYSALGRWYCDSQGIPRNGDTFKVGDLSARNKSHFDDFQFYHMDYTEITGINEQ